MKANISFFIIALAINSWLSEAKAAEKGVPLLSANPETLDSLERQRGFVGRVEALTVQTAKWTQVETVLRSSLETLATKASPLSNRLCATISVIANCSLLEAGLKQAALLTNVVLKTVSNSTAPLGVDPAQLAEPERTELASYYAVIRSYRAVRQLHDRLLNVRTRYQDLAMESLLQECSGAKPDNYLRGLIMSSATNDFTIALSNRLYLVK